MAYRTDITNGDRGGALIAAGAIQAALLFAFLNIAGTIDLHDPQSRLTLVNLAKRSPPPPPPQQSRPREKEGGSAPKNIRSQATPVVARKPRIEITRVQKIAASETPRQGLASTQGASDVPGPGSGAGGAGNGTGSGAGGNGSGRGGGVAEPPHLSTPVLQGYDFPRGVLDDWPRGATVFLRLRVDPRGYVAECMIDRGTGVATIDALMCNLAHDRLHFTPALDLSGRPVAGWFGYAQPAPR